MREITSAAELRELLGEPSRRDATKERPSLHEHDKAWLAASPFCLVATSDADGNCDVSPKGDPAGFTLVLDDTTIALPERSGNRRADGFHNILANPHVGLVYLIPGRCDTLRINGRARLVRDAAFFDDMIVKGHRPRFALVVDIEEVFYHCSKSLLRSALWKHEAWNPDAAPSRARIAKSLERKDEELADLEVYYGPRYADNIYR
ncbi:pyridoxamine 5'-phosphate oxidase family protein [Streptomyces sp. SID13666]|uniref:pyridoxamine 5'-phosphate oxidase family protein n=1 Tax=unclassified Streptomyces TaxID=2593676 RepID=UPI0013C1E8B9|nr:MULTISPECIES: pyridoxamine 5'-phosphate oxidase family protein [unclassified Streptomyces]NEA57065.1 pyridoxamine 5'-phosphate oxidase family protein [Streptomyces sp. SID13666]NEA74810.1 pyridoxamine 5'-phosphate oxidase family protein [Streptomyces sp. SID13588]